VDLDQIVRDFASLWKRSITAPSEVPKASTTDGAEVILTPNEVRHAKENKCIALFVLSNVKIERAEEGQLPPRAESATSTTRGI
jgi:hypothetical protein